MPPAVPFDRLVDFVAALVRRRRLRRGGGGRRRASALLRPIWSGTICTACFACRSISAISRPGSCGAAPRPELVSESGSVATFDGRLGPRPGRGRARHVLRGCQGEGIGDRDGRAPQRRASRPHRALCRTGRADAGLVSLHFVNTSGRHRGRSDAGRAVRRPRPADVGQSDVHRPARRSADRRSSWTRRWRRRRAAR